MLVLSRKPGESLLIGDDIEIIILAQQGSKTRLGISAPKDISVHRKEVYLRLQEEFNAAKEKLDDAEGF